MAVRPRSVFPRRCPCLSEQALLGQQRERSLGRYGLPNGSLAGRDLWQRAAEMERRGAQAVGISPWNRSVERKIDLEDARPVAEAREPPSIALGEPVTGNGEQLAWRDVGKRRSCPRQLIQRGNGYAGDNLAAEVTQIGRERVHDALRAAARQRPADVVRHCRHQHGRCCRRWPLQWDHRMRRDASKQGARWLVREPVLGYPARGLERVEPKARQRGRLHRAPQDMQWTQRGEGAIHEGAPLRDLRRDETPPGLRVWAERARHVPKRPLQYRHAPVWQRVPERRGGIDPLEAVALQGQCPEEWRRDGIGMDG